MEITSAQLVEQLVRAAFSHGDILSEKNLSRYRLLLERTHCSLPTAIDALSDLEERSITGHIQIQPDKTVTAWGVLYAFAGIIASYVVRVLRQHDKVDRKRLAQALELIEPLMRLDDTWKLLQEHHVQAILHHLQQFESRAAPDLRRALPLIDQNLVQQWADEKATTTAG